jgi:hypothetical protein
MQPRVRLRALVLAFVGLLGAQISNPSSAANPVLIHATIEDPDVTATCALIFDKSSNIVTPMVTLETPLPGTVVVRFSLFDAHRTMFATHDVAVEPPAPNGTPTPLQQFRVDRDFATASCAVRPAAASSAKAAANTAAVVLGVVAIGGVAALVASSSHGGSLQQVTRPSATPSPSPVPTFTPNPNVSPSPLPTPGTGIGLNPNSLTFSGTTTTMTTVATESGYTGMFSATTTTCGSIASISPAASSGQFTVTATGVGSCSFVISDTIGHTAQLAVSVASASGTIQSKHRDRATPMPASTTKGR